MEFKLSKEQELIQRTAKEYAEKSIEPIVKQIEDENKVPDEVIEGLRELGLLCLPVEEKYGGAGAGFEGFVVGLEQLARVSGGVGIFVSVVMLGTSTIAVHGTEEQKEKYLTGTCKGSWIPSVAMTEPDGADPRMLKTTAKKDGDYFIVNGTKRFITNTNFAGPMVVFAKDADTGRINGYIVDKFCEGYSISEPWDKLGSKGAFLSDVYLKDVKVPASNMLGTPDEGFQTLKVTMAMGKIGLSAIYLGNILAAYDEAFNYSKDRIYLGKPISQFESVRNSIVDIAMKYEAAKLMTYRIGYLADNTANKAKLVKDSAMTKIFVTETAVDVSRIAMNVFGSYGLMKDYKMSRIYRDAIVGPQIEGTANLLKTVVATDMYK